MEKTVNNISRLVALNENGELATLVIFREHCKIAYLKSIPMPLQRAIDLSVGRLVSASVATDTITRLIFLLSQQSFTNCKSATKVLHLLGSLKAMSDLRPQKHKSTFRSFPASSVLSTAISIRMPSLHLKPLYPSEEQFHHPILNHFPIYAMLLLFSTYEQCAKQTQKKIQDHHLSRNTAASAGR